MTEAISDVNPALERALEQATAELRAAAGDRLTAVLLYGSAVRGGYVDGRSDVNLLVVLKRVDLPLLAALRRALRASSRRHRFAPVFWSDDDVRGALDVFPLEFDEILRHHRRLFGDDPLAGRTVDTRHLRHQIEYELRTKLLRLRELGLRLHDRPRELTEALGYAGTSIVYLLERTASHVGGGRLTVDADLAVRCRAVKHGGDRLDAHGAEELFQRLHDELVRAVSIIDSL